ncbi:MAG: alginate export family protein [Acidobacteriota bacterium]
MATKSINEFLSRESFFIAILFGFLSFSAISAFAQQDDSGKSTAQQNPQTPATATAKPATPIAPKPIKIGDVTFSGSVRLRLENWDWFETSAADNDYTFGALLLRLSLGQQKEKFDWQVEGAFPVLMNLPESAIAPAPQGQLGLGASYFAASGRQDASAILKQAFVRFKGLGGDKPSSLRIGRFEFVDGAETTPADATLATLKRDHIAHRLIGTFAFSHIQRSFDGAHYVRNTRLSNFTFVAARPTEGVFQLNGNKELNIDFYYGAFTRLFSGKQSHQEARFFAVHYHDGRAVLKTDNRTLAARQVDSEDIRLTTLGGHYLNASKLGSGTCDLLLWGVGQFGDWGNLSHRAGAIAAEGGYQFAAAWKPWVRVGYFRSTGDGNPTDNRHTTFFQMLPTPRIYARIPFYNLMNNQDVFAQLRLKPHARVALRTDVRYLRLSNRRDLWYVGGGAFQKSTFGYVGRPSGGTKGMGTLFDFSMDVALTARSALTFYVGGVRGGGVESAIYPQGGNHPQARFLYLEFLQRW